MLKSSSLCLYSSNLGTFWLKIEQFWPFEEISIFSNGGHLGYRMALTDTILKGDHPRIISAQFGWDWLSSFRGKDFFLNFTPPLFSIFSLAAILVGSWDHRGPPKDHSTKVWLQLAQWFLRRRLKCEMLTEHRHSFHSKNICPLLFLNLVRKRRGHIFFESNKCLCDGRTTDEK